MKAHILLYLFLLSNSILFGQAFETEIKNLRTNEEIEKYWLKLKENDHSHRGRDRIDTNDNNNYKKSILTIKHHGFPANSKIPFVIAVHQKSTFVNEYYFPIFYFAYKKGGVDSNWFYHYLRGLYRNRFERDLIRGREIGPEEVDSIVFSLKPFLNFKIDYSIESFDSLHNLHTSEMNKIIKSDTLSIWTNMDSGKIYFINYLGRIYSHKVWNDNSYAWPQEIVFNKRKKRYDFLTKKHDDYMLIDNKNLIFIQYLMPTEIYTK
jgi:hypothetical protein